MASDRSEDIKEAELLSLLLGDLAFRILDVVTFNNRLGRVFTQEKADGNDIQQYCLLTLQESEMELDGPRPGRATANMAKVERKKRTSLENMVKMRVGWVW